MKKNWSVFLVLILILVSGVFIFLNLKNKKTLISEGVVATSKKGNITESDIEKYLNELKKNFGQTLNFDELKSEEKKLVVGDILNNRIILEQAKESKILNSEEFKKRLSEVKDNLLKEMYLQDLISKNIFDGDIKSRYNELSKAMEGKKEYKVSHILVEKEEDIKKVIEELKTEKFAEVAKKYSIDSSKDNGGEMGWILEGQTAKEFDDVLKKIALNIISKPFKTQFGWHVLIKKEEKDAVVPEFDDKLKEAIRASLSKEYIKNISVKNIENLDIQLLK